MSKNRLQNKQGSSLVAFREQYATKAARWFSASLVGLAWLLGAGTPCLAVSEPTQFDDPFIAKGAKPYSPYPEQNFPNRVFFGDTHLHTSYL